MITSSSPRPASGRPTATVSPAESVRAVWPASRGEILGDSGPDATLTAALYEGPPTDAGPQIIANAADYVDAAVVFRQFSCPGCWTALYSAVVPAGDGTTPVTTPLAGGLVTA
jgi:hypothetical protein